MTEVPPYVHRYEVRRPIESLDVGTQVNNTLSEYRKTFIKSNAMAEMKDHMHHLARWENKILTKIRIEHTYEIN